MTARRWGQADTASETELDAEEVGAYGASSIGKLLDAIAPLIGETGDAPAVLVNGRRIASPEDITGYPPEALSRVAILPAEAAAHYGYPSSQRVVNLELKQRFVSWNIDGGVTVPTAGGRHGAQWTVGRFAIDGDVRWNAQFAVSDETMLRKSARHIPVSETASALLGSLGAADRIDPNRFEALIGAMRSLNANASVTRPLGPLSASFSLNAGRSRTRQLVGMPVGSIVLPAPGEAVVLGRLLGDRALESRQDSETFGISASLSGAIGGWQSSLSLSYAQTHGTAVHDRGYDVSAVQTLVDAGGQGFDPAGPWPATPLLSDRSRSGSNMLGAVFNASGPVLKLPAGQVRTSLTVNANRDRSHDTSPDTEHPYRSRSDRIDARLSLAIPIASRARGFLAPLGEVGFDMVVEAGAATGSRARRKWDAALRWIPFSFLNLRASLGQENAEPSFDQLHGPRVEVVSRLFDYMRQDYVQPLRIFGGNPDLVGGRIRTMSFTAMMRPFGDDSATINLGYREQSARHGISSFPALTPAVERAFPERVTRDATGRLLSIDARPINLSRDRMTSLSSGLTLQYTQKPAAPGGDAADAVPRPWTVSLTITHVWQLSRETLIRPGLPILDRLRDGGLPRHNASLDLVAGRPGWGMTLRGNWIGAAHVGSEAGGDTASGFRYAPSLLFDLSLFIEPEHWIGGEGERGWMSGLRIGLDIQNLFDGYRKMTLLGSSGGPRGYTRDEIDPLGRTIRLGLRRQF